MPCGFSGDTGTRVTTNLTQWPPSGPPREPARRGQEAHRGLGRAAPSRHIVIILKQHKQGKAFGGYRAGGWLAFGSLIALSFQPKAPAGAVWMVSKYLNRPNH